MNFTLLVVYLNLGPNTDSIATRTMPEVAGLLLFLASSLSCLIGYVATQCSILTTSFSQTRRVIMDHESSTLRRTKGGGQPQTVDPRVKSQNTRSHSRSIRDFFTRHFAPNTSRSPRFVHSKKSRLRPQPMINPSRRS
jgi:hypothetical protein